MRRTSTPPTKTEPSSASQKRGTSDASVDLPPPDGPTRATVAPAGTEAALAERLTEKARYHFDAVFCPTLAEAVEQAKANSRRGLLVCGSEAIALEALKLFS